jgi:hypothetical protein
MQFLPRGPTAAFGHKTEVGIAIIYGAKDSLGIVVTGYATRDSI